MHYRFYESLIGRLLLAGIGDELQHIRFPNGKKPCQPQPHWRLANDRFHDVIAQLDAYFNNELKQFDIKLNPQGTEFQKQVWQAIKQISFGQTVSYGHIAAKIGRPKANRAVGGATGANPLPIVIPCHRVMGSNGKLTGFGGGLDTKTWLLKHENLDG